MTQKRGKFESLHSFTLIHITIRKYCMSHLVSWFSM